MLHCAGATKAVITISINNQVTEKITSNSPAVDITLTHGQTAQVQGSGLNVNGCGQLPNYGIYEYSGFVTFVGVSLAAVPSGSCSGVKPAVNGVTTPGTQDVYHPSAQVIRQYSSDWVLSVKDSLNRTIVRKYTTQPTYTVACGDDCPEGYLKCNCKEYPGYCCIPCGEIRNSIASATSALRGLNRG